MPRGYATMDEAVVPRGYRIRVDFARLFAGRRRDGFAYKIHRWHELKASPANLVAIFRAFFPTLDLTSECLQENLDRLCAALNTVSRWPVGMLATVEETDHGLIDRWEGRCRKAAVS
jgi:hypothetical protein